MTTPTTLLILGASGDLTSRLLLPAIAQLLHRQPDRELVLRGAGSDDWTEERWHQAVRDAFATVDNDGDGKGDVDSERELDRVAGTTYVKADVTDKDALAALVAGVDGSLVIYFALPPAVTAAACAVLVDIALPENTVLALEKPFGNDQQSAAALNALLTRIVPENRIFRVDHFLGRSTILNIMGVRFANRLVEPVWSADHVQSVLVRYDEGLALENRARYYDKAGALVDMIQSHLLQVLAILAMEQPADLDEIDLRDAMAAALRATRIVGDDATSSTRRARYTAGTSGDHPSRPTWTSPGWIRRAAPRHWPRSPARCRPHAGRACRSRCAAARLSPSGTPRSW